MLSEPDRHPDDPRPRNLAPDPHNQASDPSAQGSSDSTRAQGRHLSIDLNCDMGEGMSTDANLFPFISSANIACGGHAGDDDIMRRTIELALQHNVAIGAHPGYPDRPNFGRIDILGKGLTMAELADTLIRQIGRLQQIAREFGVTIRHVKPHGALYNRAAKDPAVSRLINDALRAIRPDLLLYGLSGSEMERQAATADIPFVSEVFADRTYQCDGTLTPRTQPHALIEDPTQAVHQVLRMVREGRVAAYDIPPVIPAVDDASALAIDTPPHEITLRAETVCLHGDGPHAVSFAKLIHAALQQDGIRIQAPASFPG